MAVDQGGRVWCLICTPYAYPIGQDRLWLLIMAGKLG